MNKRESCRSVCNLNIAPRKYNSFDSFVTGISQVTLFSRENHRIPISIAHSNRPQPRPCKPDQPHTSISTPDATYSLPPSPSSHRTPKEVPASSLASSCIDAFHQQTLSHFGVSQIPVAVLFKDWCALTTSPFHSTSRHNFFRKEEKRC